MIAVSNASMMCASYLRNLCFSRESEDCQKLCPRFEPDHRRNWWDGCLSPLPLQSLVVDSYTSTIISVIGTLVSCEECNLYTQCLSTSSISSTQGPDTKGPQGPHPLSLRRTVSVPAEKCWKRFCYFRNVIQLLLLSSLRRPNYTTLILI